MEVMAFLQYTCALASSSSSLHLVLYSDYFYSLNKISDPDGIQDPLLQAAKEWQFFFPLWEQIIKLEHTYDFFNAI